MADDAEQVDRMFRIIELRAEVEKLTDGRMAVDEPMDIPPELEEQFWEHVLEYERADTISHRELLERDGVSLPPSEELTDEELSLKLIEVIHTLADHRIYLESTDHLGDRELYRFLLQEILDERGPDLPSTSGMNYHIDLVGSGSEKDIDLWMRYYAGEDTRRRWAESWPDYDMPPHEHPPYDRDRHLPRPKDGV